LIPSGRIFCPKQELAFPAFVRTKDLVLSFDAYGLSIFSNGVVPYSIPDLVRASRAAGEPINDDFGERLSATLRRRSCSAALQQLG
jgi:hypothetical protein